MNVNVGDKVEVISECRSQGFKGIVKKVNGLSVYVEYCSIPSWWYNNNGAWYRKTSLAVLEPKISKIAAEFKDDSSTKKVGVFFVNYSNLKEFVNNEFCHADEVFMVNAYSAEHCAKILQNEIKSDQVDPDYYEYLVYDGNIYKVEEISTISIDQMTKDEL